MSAPKTLSGTDGGVIKARLLTTVPFAGRPFRPPRIGTTIAPDCSRQDNLIGRLTVEHAVIKQREDEVMQYSMAPAGRRTTGGVR